MEPLPEGQWAMGKALPGTMRHCGQGGVEAECVKVGPGNVPLGAEPIQDRWLALQLPHSVNPCGLQAILAPNLLCRHRRSPGQLASCRHTDCTTAHRCALCRDQGAVQARPCSM